VSAIIGVDPYILRKIGTYSSTIIRTLSIIQAALIVYFYIGFTVLSKYLLDVDWWLAFAVGLVPAAAFTVIFSFTLITWKTLAIKRQRTTEQVVSGFVIRIAYLGFLLVIASTFTLVHQFPQWTQTEVMAYKQELIETYQSKIKNDQEASITSYPQSESTNSLPSTTLNTAASDELAAFKEEIQSNTFFMHACGIMLIHPTAIMVYVLLILFLAGYLSLYYYHVARSGSEYQLAEAALSNKLVHSLSSAMTHDTNDFLRKKFDYLATGAIKSEYFEDEPLQKTDPVAKQTHSDFVKALHGIS
jgi:uncharacterized membrane protein